MKRHCLTARCLGWHFWCSLIAFCRSLSGRHNSLWLSSVVLLAFDFLEILLQTPQAEHPPVPATRLWRLNLESNWNQKWCPLLISKEEHFHLGHLSSLCSGGKYNQCQCWGSSGLSEGHSVASQEDGTCWFCGEHWPGRDHMDSFAKFSFRHELLMTQDHNEGSPRSFLHLSVALFLCAPQPRTLSFHFDGWWWGLGSCSIRWRAVIDCCRLMAANLVDGKCY